MRMGADGMEARYYIPGDCLHMLPFVDSPPVDRIFSKVSLGFSTCLLFLSVCISFLSTCTQPTHNFANTMKLVTVRILTQGLLGVIMSCKFTRKLYWAKEI